jgi:hypothetical protein
MSLTELKQLCEQFIQDYSQCTEKDERSDVVQQFVEILEEDHKKVISTLDTNKGI